MLFADAAIAGFAALALLARNWRLQLAWPGGVAAADPGGADAPERRGAAAGGGGDAWRHRAPHTGKPAGAYGAGLLAVTVLLAGGASWRWRRAATAATGAAAEIRLAQSYDLAGALAHDNQALRCLDCKAPIRSCAALLRGRGAALYTPLRNDPFAADPAISQALADAPDGAISARLAGAGSDSIPGFTCVPAGGFRAGAARTGPRGVPFRGLCGN